MSKPVDWEKVRRNRQVPSASRPVMMPSMAAVNRRAVTIIRRKYPDCIDCAEVRSRPPTGPHALMPKVCRKHFWEMRAECEKIREEWAP